ncbi:MAG: aldo/keto reductase [Clostridia bacterium]|nr:aldo/keto reductase [Clostridia bacterium]
MIYNDFQGKSLSRLGFGTMRLPVKENKEIDVPAVREMVDYALKHGVNYFDTAYPYHGGMSEIVVGEVLSAYPRDSFYLATKYPGHQISDHYDPSEIFEEQLKKCKVDYFDFYLLHNLNESSVKIYMNEEYGIIDYFLKQKELGRIKHLGFSCHCDVPTLEMFLNAYGKYMELCQIQFNYLDETLQEAGKKYDLLTKRGIPVWVMEPVRGGKLAVLPNDAEEKMRAFRPDESIPSWAFRWLINHENVKMILSGMSNMEQMQDNVKTFSGGKPITDEEIRLLEEVAERLKNSLPCTSCRYCTDGCPMGLDIPKLIAAYNELKVYASINVVMRLEALPQDKLPSACIGCGKCARSCPQRIDIPKAMKELSEMLDKLPKWSTICAERAAAANKAKESIRKD